MAGSLVNVAEDLALNCIFRDAGTKPTEWYVGLATASINEDDGLSDITEEDDANYERQSIEFTSPSDNGDGAQEIENDAQIDFPAYDSDADNGVSHAFIATSSDNSGDLLAVIELDESKSPVSGEVLSFDAGGLKINID